jgi:small-conductance mechanosensitive channel
MPPTGRNIAGIPGPCENDIMTTVQPVAKNLVDALLSDLSNTVLMAQGGAILAAAALAWLLVNQLEKRLPEKFVSIWLANEWRRFLVPLATLLLVLVARPIVATWHSTHLLNLAVPLLLSMFSIQLSFFFLRSLFNPGPGLRAIERVVSWMIWGLVALHIAGYLDEVISALDAIGFNVGKQHISLYTALLGIVSVIVTLLAALSLGQLFENRLNASGALNMNLRIALSKIVRSLLLLIAVLIALPLVGIDITVLSVFGGALGVGLGLGLQKIASNYVSGFTLLLENSIRIGDMVDVGGRYGQVRQIATRYTLLRDLDGTETILPNETMVTSPVINRSLTDKDNRIFLPIQVAYGSDLGLVREIMLRAATEHSKVVETPQPAVLLKGFGESGIDMELAVWINTPDEGERLLRSDLNWAIWEAFQKAKIEIPFPQRVLHMADTPVAPS